MKHQFNHFFILVFICVQFFLIKSALAEEPSIPNALSDIKVLEQTIISERTTDFLVSSQFLVKPTMLRITLPNHYQQSEEAYPVLYLLHGGAADHTQWLDLGIEQESENLNVILVQPDGGKGSWYRDAKYSSFGTKAKWESYFIQALIPWVDENFRSKANAQQRAIAGLSMGGYGAMIIAARFPDYFTSVSSFSGAVDISGGLVACWIGVSPFIETRVPYTIFGMWPFDEKTRLENNPLTLAEHLKGKHLAFYFGNGNKGPLDDFSVFNLPYRFMGWLQEKEVHDMNIRMHQKLLALDIDHDYKPYGDGMHASAYWEKSFKEELPIIMQVFEKNAKEVQDE